MNAVSVRAPLPWQQEQWASLSQRLHSNTLHHGLLFSGPAGIGKRLLAQHLSGTLMCANPSDQGSCGSCKPCQLVAAGTHPDFLHVVPEEPGKQIRIAQVRDELIDFVMRTPSISTRKAVLIDPADAMNAATANCLLKSLEEPGRGTFLMLVTDAPVRLLATIRSRCEHLHLRPPPWGDALAWLTATHGDTDAEDLLGASSGCPLGALRLADSGGLQAFDRVAALLQRTVGHVAAAPSLAAEHADMDLRELLAWSQVFLGDLGRWMADPQAARVMRAAPVYSALATRIRPEHVARTLRRVIAAARDASSTANPNRQLLLESVLFDWARVAAD